MELDSLLSDSLTRASRNMKHTVRSASDRSKKRREKGSHVLSQFFANTSGPLTMTLCLFYNVSEAYTDQFRGLPHNLER